MALDHAPEIRELGGHSPFRRADHLHLAQNRLTAPVLQSEPEASGGDVGLGHRFDVL